MPATWLEIADTTVKIGLGALISGASAYFLARHNHSSSIEKEYISKHRAVLEQVLIGCDDQQKRLREYGERITEFYQYASRNNDQMQSSEIERWRVDLLDSRQKLYSSLSVAYKRAKI